MTGAADPAANAACSGCRKKHLKCEWNIDAAAAACSSDGRALTGCVRCTVGGLRCERGLNVRFRHYPTRLIDFGNHRWVAYPRRVRFVDETRDIEALYGDDDDDVPEASGAAWRASLSPPTPRQELGPWQRPRGHSRVEMVLESKGSRLHSYRNLDQRSLSAIPSASGLSLATPNDAFLGRPFPLHSWREAKLMKYYLEYMCHWFDVCDTTRQFAVHVPRKAMSCPTLLNAIYALSSRHLSLKEGQCDEWISNQYHERCLRQLSSVSNDSNALLDDDLLAATILLRTLEELEVPLLGTDNEGHLMGVQVFMNARSGSSAAVSSLRQAAYWIGLRQEVTMAVASQRPIKFPLSLSFVDQSFSPADDAMWANRIIVHCAKVVEFCFGQGQHSPHDHRALIEYDDGWLRCRPSTFVPIAYMDADASRGEVFPHILYFSHAVVVGVVHSMLAQALLMCCDPALPSMARGRLIRQRILQLCGTALSNESTIPAMITASLGIATCGDRFDDHVERMALLDVLTKTEGDHAWPTGKIQGRLKNAWGWA
ncbi:fungal specific transcription factor [Hirsutella rhossiliensis]|uniref:Fungal specific transcription factor domain-containing protein n=1 Tax=Hirsutella rhossiliensis TaxID=111463 RepID=A0A9P8SHX0_9HYPO|nr:fungal specific transcription factor domain-containing protein [Hirsutella rhossiliensis]KAH0961446.1 fungal specific transcription factor domain-containing protein [Hirsutella rhossiliensis]